MLLSENGFTECLDIEIQSSTINIGKGSDEGGELGSGVAKDLEFYLLVAKIITHVMYFGIKGNHFCDKTGMQSVLLSDVGKENCGY